MGASQEVKCTAKLYIDRAGAAGTEQFIIFLLAVLTVPAGGGSLELLDSREMSVHKYCEKQRTGQR